MLKSLLSNPIQQMQLQVTSEQEDNLNQKQDQVMDIDINNQQSLHHQVQSIIASTFFEINQLEQDAISQLASEYEDKTNLHLNLQSFAEKQKQQFPITYFHEETIKEHKLFEELHMTLNHLKEVKFKFILLLQIDLVQNKSMKIIDQIKQNIQRFEKIIMLLESQLSMIEFIQKNQSSLHFKEKYYEKYVLTLHNFAIDINILSKSQKQSSSYIGQRDVSSGKELGSYDSLYQEQQASIINLKSIIQTQQTLRQILRQYSTAITDFQELISQRSQQRYIIRALNILKVINAKVTTISEVLPYCCTTDKNDLFSFETSTSRWQKLISESITYRTFADKDTLKKSFDNFKTNLNLVNASMGILNKTRKLKLLNFSNWIQILKSTQYLMKCFIFKDAAKKQAQYMIASANTQLMKQIWNLPEHKIFRDFAQFVFPSIQHSQRLYIPRICKQYFNSNGTISLPSTKISFLNQYGNQLFKKKDYNDSLRIRINAKYHLKAKFNIIDEHIKKSSQGNGLLIRGLSTVCDTFNKICNMSKNNIAVPDKLIFHIHGGGFISMSSFIHQVYTRTWANQLQIPIVSVDYGKAPQHPYPESLYDCLEAYIWILYCFKQVYNVYPKKIVFLGDSAGGNLAASLINILIAWKLRVPDGLVMCYPVLSVTTKKYTKSLLGTLQDLILPHTLLKLCQTSYAKHRQSQNDPLISPLFTPAQYLKRFPQTQIFVGSKDPFHDDCCRFTEKINSVNPGRCFLTIFEQFPHGFLQFDIKTHPHQYTRRANKQICESIRKIFQ